MNSFLFYKGISPQDKKNLWGAFQVAMKAWGTCGKSFEIVIRDPKEERSPRALKGYWRLIGIITDWMRDEGNNFVKDEVSDYFKMQVGHKKKIGDKYVAKSIANNAGCSWIEMRVLLEYILRFGAENKIIGCELTSDEERQFKKYYGVD